MAYIPWVRVCGVADLKGVVHDLGVSVVVVDAQDGGSGHCGVGSTLTA